MLGGPWLLRNAGYDELNAGIVAYNNHQWDVTIARMGSALTAGDLIPDLACVAHLDRGDAYIAQKNLNLALEDFSACIALRPDDPVALFHRADIYYKLDKPEELRRDAQALLTVIPDDADARALVAEADELLGDTAGLLKEAQINLANYPQSWFTNFQVGIAFFLSGQAVKAADIFDQLVGARNYPQEHYPYIWLWSGMAAIKQNKPFTRSIRLDFDNENKWPGPLMDFYRGKTTEEVVRAAAKEPGQICEADFYLGEWQLLHGDKSAARPLLDKAASQCPRGFNEWQAAKSEIKNEF